MRRSGTLLLFASFSVLAGTPVPSSLVLPVEFDLSAFIGQAERELPSRMAAPWETVGRTVKFPVAYRYELERSPLEVSGTGDRVRISTRVRYKVDVGLPAPSTREGLVWRRVNGCQPRKTATVSLDTRIDFAPDWSLRARSTPRIEIAEPCRLTAAREMVQVDISEKVRLAFADGLSRAARDFDRRLAEQRALRDLAAKAWSGLQTPIPVGDTLWLALRPSRVRVMTPSIAGRLLKTGVVVEGAPEFVSEVPTESPHELPALELTPARELFELAWTAQMSWPEAIQNLRDALLGKVVKVAGRRTVKIEDVDLRPLGERVLVTADVSGGLRGRIQLTGRPRYESPALEFADLDFTLDTSNFLIRVADWFRHDSTKRQLAKMARLDLLKTMERSRARLESALRERLGDGLRLQGEVTAADPVEFAFDDSGLRLAARFTGAMVLRAAP